MAAAVAPDNDSMAMLASELSTAMDHLEGSGMERELNTYSSESGLRLGALHHQTTQDAESAQRTTASSPVDQFTTPISHSPQDSTDLGHLPSSDLADTSQTTNATSTMSDGKSSVRKRSGSGAGVLARLTSRNSFIGLDRILSNQSAGQSSTTETESSTKPKIDKAALTRSKSKYKSGVNWDNPDFVNAEEPFEASSSPLEERKMDFFVEPTEDADQQALASAGGTKAALAQSRASAIGVGAAFFPAAQRAAEQVSQATQLAAMQSSAPRQFGSRTPRGQDSRSPESLSPVHSTNHGEISSSSRISADGQKYTTEQAQRILQSARDAVVMSNAAVMRSPPTQNGQSVESAPVPEKPTEDSPQVKEDVAANKKKARKSFMGFGMGKDKKAKEAKSNTSKKGLEKTSSTTNLTAAEQGAALASVKSESGSDTSPKQEGSNSPDSANATAGRRRRFNDTRELNLVASQLAAEALLPPSADHSRHASMIGVLSQNGGHQYDVSNGSLPPASSSSAAGFSMPQPAFASEARTTSYNGSPISGSPRTQPTDISRYEQPRAAFARSTHSTSSLPGSPSLTQSAKLSGLPSDMLTGLNDGPYPHLPPRTYDLSDPFGVPMMPSEFDIPSINLGGRNSLPNTAAPYRTRGMSSGSAGRRSVLQMSMHNPDQEMQGLTKKPKSGKNTPFGSRAPSRQATPKSSKTNLREAAKEDAGKSSAPPALAASSQTVESTVQLKKPEASDSQDSLKPVAQKSSRLSIFGIKKNKSSTEVNKILAGKENQQLKPPNNNGASSTSNFGGSSDRHSASNDSTTSRLGNDARSASLSAQSLVKVPSPTMTSGSGSSHERSAMGSASDGSNSYGNIITSTATTPEVPISKADVFSSSQTQGIGSPLVAALGQSSDQQPTPKPSTQNLSNGHAKTSVTSTPVQASAPIYEALATSTDSNPKKMSTASLTPQSTGKAVSKEASIPPSSPAKSSKSVRPSLTKIKSNTGGGKSKVGKFISKFGASRDGKQQPPIPTSKSQTHLENNQQQTLPPLPADANKYATVNGKMNASKDNLNGGEKGKAQTKFGQFRANLRNEWKV
ncbi:uncharacterized protein FA14DRAFT_160206 [Meira miltonrushii]|uniref:Uncharacterized protein n=1 Tax=Meira miltonrushii TaxID=1280837 RepID=A0A316VB59_9BASI|nr:uncharacterized protein FA14DRAFT_160206 [Meira miltonrushii]PWN34720.1 hypothetical protein FA14DRAFT_160206 [Meira miltonrushii]